MSRERILVITSEIFFAPQIESTILNSGFDLVWLTDTLALKNKSVIDFIETITPVTIIVGLDDFTLPVWDWVATIKEDSRTAKIPMIAFGPHKDVKLFEKGKALGIEKIVAKSRFVTGLGDILKDTISNRNG